MIAPDRDGSMPPFGGFAPNDNRPDNSFGRGEIRLTDVSVGYGDEIVIDQMNLEIPRGDFVCVDGPSGAGKSTLLKLLYGRLRPRRGLAVVDGVNMGKLPSRHISRFRRQIGCVFQSYELLPHLSALENVLLPLQLAQRDLDHPQERAEAALERVGLAHKVESMPRELSGGQQQRVAIARAIAHEPRILLADEPTGNLDQDSTGEVMDAFERFHEQGGTVVMATHDEALRQHYAEHVVHIVPRAA